MRLPDLAFEDDLISARLQSLEMTVCQRQRAMAEMPAFECGMKHFYDKVGSGTEGQLFALPTQKLPVSFRPKPGLEIISDMGG